MFSYSLLLFTYLIKVIHSAAIDSSIITISKNCSYLEPINFTLPKPDFVAICENPKANSTVIYKGLCILFDEIAKQLCDFYKTQSTGKLLERFTIQKIVTDNKDKIREICDILTKFIKVKDENTMNNVSLILQDQRCIRSCLDNDFSVLPICSVGAYLVNITLSSNLSTSSEPPNLHPSNGDSGETSPGDTKTSNNSSPSNEPLKKKNLSREKEIQMKISSVNKQYKTGLKKQHEQQSPKLNVKAVSDKENKQKLESKPADEEVHAKDDKPANEDLINETPTSEELIETKPSNGDSPQNEDLLHKELPQDVQSNKETGYEEMENKESVNIVPSNKEQSNKELSNDLPANEEPVKKEQINNLTGNLKVPEDNLSNKVTINKIDEEEETQDFAENAEYTDNMAEEVESKPIEKPKPKKTDEDKDIEESIASMNSQNQNIDDGDSYFFSYFMVVCMVCIGGYIVYHNKQRILALILEGRKGRKVTKGRRPNSASYQKLDSTLEEAISSSCKRNKTEVIY